MGVYLTFIFTTWITIIWLLSTLTFCSEEKKNKQRFRFSKIYLSLVNKILTHNGHNDMGLLALLYVYTGQLNMGQCCSSAVVQ